MMMLKRKLKISFKTKIGLYMFDKVCTCLLRFLYVCLGLMALAIVWNILTCYVMPEIQEGQISWNPVKD